MDIDQSLVGRLPAAVRREAGDLIARGDYGGLIDLLDERAPEPDPVVLLCQATARVRFATEVMVDSMGPACERALAQVAAARRLGAAARDADPVERFIQVMLAGVRTRVADGQHEPASYRIGSRAHEAWTAGRHAAAADLFVEAARLARAEGSTGWFNSEIRAGLCLAAAGDLDHARPILERALSFDWAGHGIWEDRHMTEHAVCALLRAAAASGDTAEFTRRWEQAVEVGARHARPFPSVWGFQEELLTATAALGLPGYCRQALERIRAREARLDRATLAKIDAAEAFLAGQP